MSKKEGRYYVEYLGWKESRGLYGRQFTEPVTRELLARRRHSEELPRMTIKINPREIQISQEKAAKSGGKPQKTKYPAIPVKDCSFVIQALYPDTDIVSCVFLGYNPYTKCAIHVHAYRFDSESTAAMFTKHVSNIIAEPTLRKRILGIEADLTELGHAVRNEDKLSNKANSNSDGMSQGTPSPQSSEGHSPSRKFPTAEEALRQRSDITIQKQPKQEFDPNAHKLFHNLQEEFEYKIRLDEVPILLPPKDYDTIVRRHGNLDIRNEVKASRSIVGPNGIFSRMETEQFHGKEEQLAADEREDSGSSKTQSTDATDTATETSNNHQFKKNTNTLELPQNGGVKRSQSDTNANLVQPSSQLRRQHSQASSDRSANSDDAYGDNLYSGFKPKHHRSRSKDDGYNSPHDDLAMYSPSYSFGQNGMRSLPTHQEDHEEDALMRTAPAGYLRSSKAPQIQRYSQQTVDRSQVKRSHSQRNSDPTSDYAGHRMMAFR